MGVSGSGKSTLARALAGQLRLPFIEGDDLHGPASVEKMRRGIALSDEDRWPWLSRVGEELAEASRRHGGAVATCSALRQAYRDRLRSATGKGLRFVFLDGNMDLLGQRMSRRKHHFMPLSLLESQFATLEPPLNEPDVVRVRIDGTPETIVARVIAALGAS